MLNNEIPLHEEVCIEQLAIKIFTDIELLTRDKVGISRESYGRGEALAINYLTDLAEKFGFYVEKDEAANVILSLDNIIKTNYIIVGSHIDSVPQGGNFDGLAGVVAGFLLLVNLKGKRIRTSFPIKVLILRGEESAWYGKNCIGSKALFGLLTLEDLNSTHRSTGDKLSKAMNASGANLHLIKRSKPLINSKKIELFIEIHIEQGPILVDKDWPIAIVTGIRGNYRHHKIRCKGEAGHSGTIPRYLRKDSVFAGADLITRMDDHWNTIEQHGGDLVLTSGIFHTDIDNQAMSRIPGEILFSFESRSQDISTLDALERLLRSECKTIERERGVHFDFDNVIKSDPAECNQEVVEKLLDASESLGFPRVSVASGATHDAAIFSNQGVKTGMIFIRNDKGSHNPDERMEIKDFMKSVSTLNKFINEY